MKKCDYCGQENADEAGQCAGCATEFPVAVTVDKSPTAGFWIRLLARLIDIALGFVIVYAGLAFAFTLAALMSRAGMMPFDWLSRNHAVETQCLLGLFAQGHRREALPDP